MSAIETWDDNKYEYGLEEGIEQGRREERKRIRGFVVMHQHVELAALHKALETGVNITPDFEVGYKAALDDIRAALEEKGEK